MPRLSRRRCLAPGCRDLVSSGSRCPRHQAAQRERELERQRRVNAQRTIDASVYSSPRWREERGRFIAKHPRCRCGGLARYVDHIKPWRSFPPSQQEAAFWDKGNWQPMCGTCHSRKTAASDGGFGNPRG